MEMLHLAREVMKTIEANGFSAFMVGGAVRDYILGREPADIDIATNASVEQLESFFSRTVPLGKRHGTVIVRKNGVSFEVSSFKGGPKLIDDLCLRDFTINAMAMDRSMSVIDPLGGKKDLTECLIRAAGSPLDRFREDPLRMVRAIRFVSQLAFAADDDVKDGIILLGSLIKKVSRERIVAEWEKILGGGNWKQAMQLILDTALYSHLPFLTKDGLELLITFDIAEPLSDVEWWTLICAAWQIKEPDRYLTDLFKSNQVKGKVSQLLANINKRQRDGWGDLLLYQAGASAYTVEKLAAILEKKPVAVTSLELEEMWSCLPIKNRSELAINGAELQTYFNRGPGDWIRLYLEMAEQGVLTKQIPNKKEPIFAWLLKGGASV